LAFGFWVLALASLGSWLLVFVGFLAWVSLGFWLLAFGRTSVDYTYIQQKCGQKPKAKSQVKPKPKSQQKPKNKSQVKPKPKSQQKPKTKSQEKPKSKAKGQKPSGHANERLKHKKSLNKTHPKKYTIHRKMQP
jgi:hypothetical protein